MKKLVLASALALYSVVGFSQKLDKVSTFYMLQKFEDAKTEIDKAMADPKAQTNPEAWLWKASIYAELYANETTRTKYPDASTQAYEALTKYRQLDPSLKGLKENGARPMVLLYSTAFNIGRTYFGESKWNEAFSNFKISEEMGDLIITNGLSNNPQQKIDTFTVLYTGYAAQNAQKIAEAIKYYEKFANQQIGGKDFMDVYRYLLNYYLNNKDNGNFQKYLAVAKTVYPGEAAMWNEYDMEYMSKNSSLSQIIEAYKKGDQGGAFTAEQYASYGQALANANKEEVAKMDSLQQSELRKTAATAFQKAFEKNQSGIDAFNAGIMYYNEWGVLDEKYSALRGTAADLKAKREQVEKQQHAVADIAITWMEKAYTALKAKENRSKIEQNCLGKSVDFLTNLYLWKRDKSRGKDVKAFDVFDAKYKQYDAEHGKYQ